MHTSAAPILVWPNAFIYHANIIRSAVSAVWARHILSIALPTSRTMREWVCLAGTRFLRPMLSLGVHLPHLDNQTIDQSHLCIPPMRLWVVRTFNAARPVGWWISTQRARLPHGDRPPCCDGSFQILFCLEILGSVHSNVLLWCCKTPRSSVVPC